MISRTSSRSALAVATVLGVWLAATPCLAAKKRAPEAPAATTAPAWKDVGDAYESARLLNDAGRAAALEPVESSVTRVLHADATDDVRLAARFLSARLHVERGDYAGAADAYRDAANAAGNGPFADDAEFAAIQSLEASGHDGEAAKEWSRWEKRHPSSPLMSEARLAEAWNALRRGETEDGSRRLAALVQGAPWMARDSRVTLARATALMLTDRPADVLTLLGDRPDGAGAAYLRAVALQRTGQLLKAAAAYQTVAERTPDGPLADMARLAKANTFLAARDYRSAAEEFSRVVARVHDENVRAEAELRAAGSVFLAGQTDSALVMLRDVVQRHDGTEVAARAQFLVGEGLVSQGQFEPAIVEYNHVLTRYFQHRVAASAQYRVARCLDALGRRADATGSYQAVVSGYPLEPEAPAAAYLAGVGLLQQNRPRVAAPFFQIVLDRYARHDAKGQVVFARPEHAELVDAALCMLEYAYHVSGDLGQLSGAPHLLLGQLPPSHSTWRAQALLIDADASAAQGRYAEAEATLERLAHDFPDHPVGASAGKLLAWTYSREGRDSLAIATEERLLARWGTGGQDEIVSSAFLDIAHSRFNQKRYKEAAGAYEDFLHRWPTHVQRLAALYQAGLCYLRLDRAGDAVDRWERLVRDSASAPLAERAWARAGDVYFQADRFVDAKRCYQGLLDHFATSTAAGLASLRLAQCEYNAGHDAAALEAFSATEQRFPETPYAHEARRGTELALYRLSQQKDGGAVLAQLVDQYPNSAFAADALLQIAKRAYAEKRWAAAADGFRQVVSRFPSYSAADQAQFLMADSWAHAGANTDALNAYEQFLSYFPESNLVPTVSLRLGLLRFDAKDYMQAAVAFTRALDDSTAAVDIRSAARYDLALCQRQLGQTDEARADLERYRAEFPNGQHAAAVAYQLADLDETAGNLDEAEKGFETALPRAPTAALAAEIAFRLGRCREQKKDVDGALKAYRTASACPDLDQPFRLSALARLAALHESRHEPAQAVAAYRDIMQNSKDKELVAAATERVTQLSASTHRR